MYDPFYFFLDSVFIIKVGTGKSYCMIYENLLDLYELKSLSSLSLTNLIHTNVITFFSVEKMHNAGICDVKNAIFLQEQSSLCHGKMPRAVIGKGKS